METLFPDSFVEPASLSMLTAIVPAVTFEGTDDYETTSLTPGLGGNSLHLLFTKLASLCEHHAGLRFSVTQIDTQHLYKNFLRKHLEKSSLESLRGANTLAWMLAECTPPRHEHLRTAYLETQLTREETVARRRAYISFFSLGIAPLGIRVYKTCCGRKKKSESISQGQLLRVSSAGAAFDEL